MKLICTEDCRIGPGSLTGKGGTLFTSLLVLFMPKCAFCWAAYMSIFSSAGLCISYQPWFFPVSVILFLVTLTKLLILAIRRRNFMSVGLALLAGLLIILQRSVPGINAMKFVAILLLTMAVMMDTLLIMYKRLMQHLHTFFVQL